MRATPSAFITNLRLAKSLCARLLFLLSLCILLTACPSSGGDLLPLTENNGGSLESASFRNDTLGLKRNQLTLKARGSWSASDASTFVTLEVNNASPAGIRIAFDSCEMVNNESHQRLTLRSVAEYRDGSVPAFISERTVTIENGQAKKYDLNFYLKSEDNRASVSRNVLGQTVNLRVPVGGPDGTNALADFLFSFKYVEYQH